MRYLTLLLALCAACFGGVARDGTCAQGQGTGHSCTFSATNTNDVKIIFASWESGTAAIATPSGWTSIASFHTGSNTCCSYNLGCNISSSSSDTSSGTWTNATGISGISFSGVPVTTTANCASVAVGGFGFAGTGIAGSDLTIEGITLTKTDWVAAFSFNANNSECTPTGLTSVASSGSSLDFVRAYDTEGAVSSFSTLTCSNSGVSWNSATVQIVSVVPNQFPQIY